MVIRVYWKLEAAGKLKVDRACANADIAEQVKADLIKDGWTVTEVSRKDYDKIGALV
jgi:hypothetical protein